MNNRRFESVEVSAVIDLLKEELEHKTVFPDTREVETTMQWEQEWHMHSLSPIIDAIDPYYNGYNDDGTIADCWYTAENHENSVQRRRAILDSLMRFGRAKVVEVGGRDAHYHNPCDAYYTVTKIRPDIRFALREELRVMVKRREQPITEEALRCIYGVVPLIDAIDLRYLGSVASDHVQGLSIRERWETAQYIDYNVTLPRTQDEYTRVYDRYLAMLYAAVRYGVAKVYLGTCYPWKKPTLEERLGWILQEEPMELSLSK